MRVDYKSLFEKLAKRYGNVSPEAFERILCPVLIPIHNLNNCIIKLPGQAHYRASFSILIDGCCRELIQRGCTGKFVPKEYAEGTGTWREIAKGRIINVNHKEAIGEVYIGASGKTALENALLNLSDKDYLEIDQYGAAAKVLSGLVEYSLARIISDQGYNVRRMPADVARHLGTYYHYDFEFERDGIVKKVEVKSLWGTDTRLARLIHSKGGEYRTSSCKFDTQDIFAVNLFLRTGDVQDFAFARSIPNDAKSYGLPRASNYCEYVHQNPP